MNYSLAGRRASVTVRLGLVVAVVVTLVGYDGLAFAEPRNARVPSTSINGSPESPECEQAREAARARSIREREKPPATPKPTTPPPIWDPDQPRNRLGPTTRGAQPNPVFATYRPDDATGGNGATPVSHARTRPRHSLYRCRV